MGQLNFPSSVMVFRSEFFAVRLAVALINIIVLIQNFQDAAKVLLFFAGHGTAKFSFFRDGLQIGSLCRPSRCSPHKYNCPYPKFSRRRESPSLFRRSWDS